MKKYLEEANYICNKSNCSIEKEGIIHNFNYKELYLLTETDNYILTISEKGKAIFLSIAQVATSFIVPLAILFILFGGLGGSAPSSTSDSTGYSYDQNTEARNKGYSNALDAERSGRKWNGSTWE